MVRATRAAARPRGWRRAHREPREHLPDAPGGPTALAREPAATPRTPSPRSHPARLGRPLGRPRYPLSAAGAFFPDGRFFSHPPPSPSPRIPPGIPQKRVQDYGCFVDFGAKSDGLVHISELTNGFVENVADVVSENQEVKVWIKSIDSEKGRISLTMKPPPTAAELEAIKAKEAEREAKFQARKEQQKAAEAAMAKLKAVKKGQQVDGVVKSIQPFGAFVEIQDGIEGLVHVTEMSDDYNVQPEDFVKVGETVSVRILGVDGAKVKLSMKEKVDLKDVVEGIQVEASAGIMEVAFKSKGITAAQFPEAKNPTAAAAAVEAAAAEPEAEPEVSEEPAAESDESSSA